MEFSVRAILMQNEVSPARVEEVASILTDLGLWSAIADFSPLKRGMTNQLFVFTAAGQRYLLRLPGQGTEHLADRAHEAAVYRALEGQNITEEVLYISAENGVKVSRYLSGVRPCDPDDKREVSACLKLLKSFHEKKLTVGHDFDVYREIERYEAQCSHRPDAFADFAQTQADIMALRELIGKLERKDRLCHIDPVYDNFLLNGAVHLIDWEYAGMSDLHIDLAMLCIYASYDKAMTDWVIDEYYGGQAQPQDRMLVYAYMAAGAYLWVLWSEIKRESGVDYTEYEAGQYRLAQEFCRYAMALYHHEGNA